MGKQRHFWFDYLQEKRQVLRSDTDIERLDDKREGRAEGGRRFQREGPITKKDLDMVMVVLVRVTKSSRLFMERRGRRDVAEVGSRMGVMEIFRCHSHLGLKKNKQNFIFNASRDWKPMEMFLDVVGDMGVTGKSGNESCSCVQNSLKGR